MPNPPKPTKLKLLEGNPGKRPINGSEPQPIVGDTDAPDWLGGDAREEWDRVVPELRRMGLLTQVDRGTILAYCESYGSFVEATKDIQARGQMVEGARNGGGLVKNPSVGIAREAAKQMVMLAREFGLTPSARARMTTPEGSNTDADIEALFTSAN